MHLSIPKSAVGMAPSHRFSTIPHHSATFHETSNDNYNAAGGDDEHLQWAITLA
jgi:hypothetical protein